MSVYGSYPRSIRNRLLTTLADDIYNSILEEYHILRTFDDIVEDIYEKFIQNKGRLSGLIYTGWKFNINTQECIKCKENVKNDLYSIYVYWYFDNDNIALASTDIRGIDINLDEHRIKINANVIKGFNIKTIKSLFHHEFIHIKHMYLYKDKNIIFNNKNMSDNIKNIFNISDKIFNKVKDILYLLSPTEEQARINQQYRLIKDLSNKEIMDIIQDDDIAESLIKYFSKFNLYDKYLLNYHILLKNYIIDNEFDYILLLNLIGYYGHMQNILKNDIKDSSIRNMINLNTYTSIDKSNANKVKYDIDKFITKYLDKLVKSINYALKENKFDDYYKESLFK